ncbi:putative CCR4-Not complex component, Not1, MIF4G-like domain superfamily [Dioscorea sansibarensis]
MPSLPSHIAGHIQFRLQEVTDSNAEDISRELCKFVEDYSEGGLLALKCCFEQMNFDVGDVQSLQLKCHIVAAVLRYLMSRPNFSTVFCEALRTTVMTEGFLENLSNALKLSTVEQIGVGLALSESENLDFKMGGQNFCIAQLEILCADSDSTLSNERIQEIFMFLYRTKGLSELVDSFTKILSLLHLKESSLSVLFPMFTDESKTNNSIRSLDLLDDYLESDFDAILEEIEKEMSMADTVRDLGYGCTVNTKHCTEILSQFLPLNEITISKLLGTISRTHTGLEDAQNNHLTFCSALDSISAGDSSWANSWNADVLVESIKYLAPKTNWIRVMENLDHEGFFLPDESAFSFLISIYNIACQDPFPLHAICGSVWENVEGQLSFIRYAVIARPDVFTFEHSPRKMAYFDSVHRLNEYGNQAWFCIDLLEILCQLTERGHATTVRVILGYPLDHCPEVLLVGISQISTAYNLLQYEVSSMVFPIILKDSAKSNIIYHLWRVNPNLVLRGFMDECTADQNSLLRVVDICQELKMLSSVLDAAPFLFSIKMAAIASQKDYLNLEKWLDDNMSMHKDGFFEACLGFLKAVICEAANDSPDSSFHSSAAAVVNNFRETCSTFLKVLQVHCGQITSSELTEEVKKLQDACNPRTQSSVSTDSAKPEGNSDDIEAVANSYLHQMFFGELSIDAMIQMLARFKESPEKREQLIFECIVANLFEEYKFFPKYPDKQLKLAAVLFGSLIKHHLVTHLALGIALRAVLDALRRSVDSKMFIFGTKALEQFIDRLVEWRQYCNHILQISHLRGTHAELVAVIERALARISLSQSESTGSNSPPDQQQVSLASSGENMEASESSWQLVGSASAQPGQQFPSFQFQRRNLDDRLKANATSLNFSKPLLTHAGQSSLLPPPIDSASSQKTMAVQSLQTSSSQHSSTVASTVSSPGFLRPSRGMTPAGMIRQTSYITGFAALNIETLVAAAERRETPIEAPSQEVQDKILFMINNISTTNMDAKAKEFTEVLKEQYYAWFAQYMVMKRASIEPNFHDLYLKFLERVNSRALNKEIVKATYENCKVLLRSDLIKSSSEERSLLKNLGSWLGKFTIGRNQALLAREIDPKVLIIEAYEKGLMIAVIPFTSKILEPCQYSLAYQPPNPWTMGILGLLAEIYNLPNLKMNLKFDIEVLFKNLGVDMKDVKPTSLLKDRVREVEGNPDFSNKDASVAQPPVLAEVKPGVVSVLNQVEEVNNTSYASGHPSLANQYTAPVHLASSTIVDDDKIGTLMIPERVSSGQGLTQVASSPSPFTLSQLQPLISNYDSYINVNPKLTSMGLQLQFQRIIQMSLDKAIREIVSPVIQRSVTIASRTTKEMVLKDLSMESDDGVILRSARMMVGALAGSLAHVTCKEPLRVSLSSHLRVVLQALNVVTDIDQIVQSITTDNLDLGCAVIENVASVKAVELIDGEIAPAFASLRKHREATGSAYYDAGTYAQGPFARIPEALRPKPGHLSVAQMQVYKDFVRTWQNQSSQSTNVMRAGLPGIAGDSAGSSLPRVYGSNASQANNLYSSAQVAPGFSTMGQQLDTLPEESDRSSVHLLSVPSNQVGTSDAMVQNGADVSSIMSSFSVAANASELHMEASNVSKEMGAAVLLSPVTTVERLGTAVSESLLTAGEALEKYQLVAEKLESLIAKEARDAEIQGVVAEVPDIIRRCVSRDEAALAVAQKVFKSLYENASNVHHINSHVAVLSAIRDVCKLVVKELTSWVIYSDEERKFNTEITIALIHSDLLNLAEYNVHLAKLIDGGRNTALEFSISLVEELVVQESGVSMSELHNLIDALAKLAIRPGSPESLQQLVEICRNNTGNLTPQSDFTVSKEEKAKQSKDRKVPSGRASITTEESSVTETTAGDPAGFRDQVSQLFAEWGKISSLPATNDSVCSHYISQLQQLGLLKGDDITDSFFRVLTEISVAHCLATEQAITTGSLSLQSAQQPLLLTFTAIDAYAMLVVAILKFGSMDHGPSKIALLSKVLSVTVRVIQRDAEEKKSFFNPRPYFRLFINWLLDLASPDSVLDGANFQVLTSFANTFHALQPLKVPGWSFAWLELVSHRSFMPKLLMCNSPKGWPFVQRLLVDLFKFMEPYLRNAELGEPVHFLYKGTLRVLLVLLHDFPEFLCDYHFSFCDVIPPSCIQMRNVILSAFPRNMRLPDPSTPNLKIDLLAEISLSPRILSDVESTLKAKQIKADIDDYLKTRPDGSTFLTELKQRLLLPQAEANMAGTRYNVPLINSLVLYVGMQAIQQLQSKSLQQHAPTPQMTHNPPMDIFLVGAAMDIFQSLIKSLDTEGRYLFLNAVANQLRYPNNHTHYFSFVLLYLFAEATQEIIQEQITRVLLERLIVNRPHPWGLLITFIELIKNPRYSFWSRQFTHCAPEIEKLFESVSRSCGGPKAIDDSIVAGGLPDGSH